VGEGFAGEIGKRQKEKGNAETQRRRDSQRKRRKHERGKPKITVKSDCATELRLGFMAENEAGEKVTDCDEKYDEDGDGEFVLSKIGQSVVAITGS
jgi:hypothetical protein